MKFHLRAASRLYIDGVVEEMDGSTWRLTGFYGEPKSDKKERSWSALRTLNAASAVVRRPWLCLGDFNEVLFGNEKEGGLAKSQTCMDKFREALEICSLSDLGFTGDMFTWRNNNHNSAHYIRERLDRAVADAGWCARFSEFSVRNGDPHHSDHRPVIVDTTSLQVPRHYNNKNVFRFEAGWVHEEDCEMVVGNAWRLTMEARGERVANAVKEVAAELLDWGRNTLGELEKRIKFMKKGMENCRKHNITRNSVAMGKILKYRLEKLVNQRELYWKQHATTHLLNHGDRNTNFFHKFACERRRKNRITRLVRDDGGVVEDADEIHALVTSLYTSLFQTGGGSRYEELLQCVLSRVMTAMNDELVKEYTEEEVKLALDSMGDLKAPGPYGMPALFYKKYWSTVGNDVAREVIALLNGGAMQDGWNDSVVVLIPKVNNLEKLKDLHPISLCNVVYKIASKLLTNRLKKILPDVISLNQSAFVPDRLITDNVLLAYEMTHYMQNKNKGLSYYVALKLDMSKAYDRVEWEFLQKMMCKLGFQQSWVEKLMNLVTTVRYRIRVNGELTDEIKPQRGLRLGDPLSPYLFLICAEAFSCLLNAAERRGETVGIRVCQGAPSINHLLFADDSLLLFKLKTGVQSICEIFYHCMRFARGRLSIKKNRP